MLEIKENIKIHCPTPDISKRVQEKLFELGYKWADSYPHTVKNPLHFLYAYTSRYGEPKVITRSTGIDINDWFRSHRNKEIYYKDFLEELSFQNCKISFEGLSTDDISLLENILHDNNIGGYGNLPIIRNIDFLKNREIDNGSIAPYGIYIKDGESVMVGTELYFNQLDFPEIKFSDKIIQNEIIKLKDNVMGDVTLKCIKTPERAKNISEGLDYVGILIDETETQVDKYSDAAYFLCQNDKGREAKYRLNLFNPPIPPKPTIDDITEETLVYDNGLVLLYNGERKRLFTNSAYGRFEDGKQNGFSCGVTIGKNLNSVWSHLQSDWAGIASTVLANGTDCNTVLKMALKVLIKTWVQNLSSAIVLFSNNYDNPLINEVLDELANFNSEAIINPNSSNPIKVWGIYKGTNFVEDPYNYDTEEEEDEYDEDEEDN